MAYCTRHGDRCHGTLFMSRGGTILILILPWIWGMQQQGNPQPEETPTKPSLCDWGVYYNWLKLSVEGGRGWPLLHQQASGSWSLLDAKDNCLAVQMIHCSLPCRWIWWCTLVGKSSGTPAEIVFSAEIFLLLLKEYCKTETMSKFVFLWQWCRDTCGTQQS